MIDYGGLEIPTFLSIARWLWCLETLGSVANVHCNMEFRKFISEKSGKN